MPVGYADGVRAGEESGAGSLSELATRTSTPYRGQLGQAPDGQRHQAIDKRQGSRFPQGMKCFWGEVGHTAGLVPQPLLESSGLAQVGGTIQGEL